MKKIVDMDKWNEFVSKSLEHPTNFEGFYKIGLENMANFATRWLEAQPDAEELPIEDKTFEYQGYKLVQSSGNNHYMIFDDNGELCLHAQCTEPLTEEEAIKSIAFYLGFKEEE